MSYLKSLPYNILRKKTYFVPCETCVLSFLSYTSFIKGRGVERKHQGTLNRSLDAE